MVLVGMLVTAAPASTFYADVDHLARPGPLVAADRVCRFQGADSVQTQALEDAADGRW
jgi:hypothetical protein